MQLVPSLACDGSRLETGTRRKREKCMRTADTSKKDLISNEEIGGSGQPRRRIRIGGQRRWKQPPQLDAETIG